MLRSIIGSRDPGRKDRMASSKDYLDFILDQLSGLDDISYRTMMGNTLSIIAGIIAGNWLAAFTMTVFSSSL